MISEPTLKKVLDCALSSNADFAEIFIEKTLTRQLKLIDRSPSSAIYGNLFGAGIRLFDGTNVIYVTTTDLTEEGLLATAKMAAAAIDVSKTKTAGRSQPLTLSTYTNIHTYHADFQKTDKNQYIALLKDADQTARQTQNAVNQVIANLLEKNQAIQIANSKGLLIADERNYGRFVITAIAEQQNKKATGSKNAGSLATHDFLLDLDVKMLARDAANQSVTILNANYAPAGEFPVVIDKGFGGVIFHEACGHGLETTSVSKKASVFCDKLGQKIAKDCVTAIDDGTIPNAWGSISIDDEGNPTQKTNLIENGILKSYLVDTMGGIKTGYTPTGSARRESYLFAPTSRMRNTFIAPGESTLEEMIGDVDYGIYAKTMGGGSVNPGTGEYNFVVNEGYMIRQGKIAEAVKGASLIGSGIETLGRISKVGKDLDLACGMCGSQSGSVPVTVGQPPLLVDKIIVGGRSE